MNTNTNQLPPIINKGTGAGGAKTNENGLKFEDKIDNQSRLLTAGFIKKKIPGCSGKYGYYLEKVDGPDKSIVFLQKGGLQAYFKVVLGKEMCRQPDEAYLFRNGSQYTLKILEKKNQNVNGSVDTKLLAGQGFIEEYQECLDSNFTVRYAFCISEFLQKAYVSDELKYRILRKINQRHGITVLFGDDEAYWTTLDAWLYS